MTPKLTITDKDDVSTGSVVYWSLSGDIDGSRLIDEWQKQGLPIGLLPKLPSAEAALRHAVYDQRKKHLLTRRHPDGSWYLVRETDDGDGLDYALGAHIWLDENNSLNGAPMLVGSNAYDNEIASIRTAYYHYRNCLSPEDISGWLCRLTSKVNGVTLRPETGGFYYIPRCELDLWQQATSAIKAASAHTFYAIPALKSEQAAAAVLDALRREVEDEAKKLMDELNEGVLGGKALRTRISRTEATRAKVETYEALLGSKLVDIRTKLEALSASATAAALTAEAEADTAAGAR